MNVTACWKNEITTRAGLAFWLGFKLTTFLLSLSLIKTLHSEPSNEFLSSAIVHLFIFKKFLLL